MLCDSSQVIPGRKAKGNPNQSPSIQMEWRAIIVRGRKSKNGGFDMYDGVTNADAFPKRRHGDRAEVWRECFSRSDTGNAMSETPDCGLVRAAKLETFEIAEFVLTSESSLPEHAHDRPAIAIGLEGRCALVIAENATTTLARGDLLTIPADLTHRETVPNGTARCLLVSNQRSGSVSGDGVRHFNSLTIAELGWLLTDALAGNDSLGAEATAHELHALVRVGVADEAARARDPGWLAVVVEYLEDCFRSPPSLSDLSREAGVSREHIARVFRRETGLTVGQFVRLNRVLEGAMCLRQGAADLSDVALHCGYSDQSHFTREFRRFLGTTPHVHRQRFHGGGVGTNRRRQRHVMAGPRLPEG